MAELIAPGFWIFVLVTAGIWTIFALGLQMQFGLAGLLNFGAVAMMSISAYTMAICVIRLGLPLLVAAAFGIAMSGVGGLFLALVARRLRGDYFAIATIAFSETLRYVAKNATGLTGGDQGTLALPSEEGGNASYNGEWAAWSGSVQSVIKPVLGSLADREFVMLLLVWVIAIVLLFAVAWLERTSWARVLRATREDDQVPEVLGKNVVRFRTQVLVLGSMLGGLAGVLYALEFSFVQPANFEPLVTFFAWMIILLGGATRVWAVPVGALIFGFIFAGTRFFEFPPFTWLESSDRAYVRLIIVGLVLIAIVMWRPQGILGNRKEMILE